MSGLFKGQHTTVDRVAGIQLQTSCQGTGVVLLFGTNRTAGNLLDVDDFTAHEVTSSVGKGGGSTSSSWWYSAGVIIEICHGPIGGVNRVWRNNENARGLDAYGFTLVLGNIPQDPWETWVTKHPSKASAFAGVAYVANPAANLGTTGSVGNYSFEVRGLLATEADLSSPDINIGTGDGTTNHWALYDGIGQHLTSLLQIAKASIEVGGTVADPATYEIRNGWVQTYTETWVHDDIGPGYRTVRRVVDPANLYIQFATPPADGAAITWADGAWIPYDALPEAVIPAYLSDPDYGALWDEGKIDDLAAFGLYCKAMGFVISPVVRELKPAADHLQEMLDATNSEAVHHAGPDGMVLSVIPYADQEVTGNGVTYTPDVTPLYDVGFDDYLGVVDEDGQPTGEDPVSAERTSPAEVYNTVPVSFNDRNNAYNATSVSDPEPSDRALNGPKVAAALVLPCIVKHVHAKVISRIRAQRNVNVRTKYTFKLGWRYMLLEPMDIITLTDPLLGIYYQAVRIIDVEIPDETGESSGCTYTAEEWPFGTGHASPGSTLDPGSNTVPNTAVSGGSCNPPVIAALPLKFSGGQPQVVIGASGGPLWGGCQVWVSTDDETYEPVGTISKRARHGYLTADMGDTGGASVDVSACGLQLDGVTADQAAAWQTATYCDCEVWGWQTATLTAAGQYDLGGAIRGGFGTPALPHGQYAPFVVLDDAPLYLPRRADWVGKTLYVKLPSYNIWGRGQQDLADVPAYTLITTSHLALAIVDGSIQVTSAGTLPGGESAEWTLYHQVFQGGTDNISDPEANPLNLTGGAFVWTESNPLAGATHVFWVQVVVDGQLTIFAKEILTIPLDGLQDTLQNLQDQIAGMGGGGSLKAADKPAVIAAHDSLTAQVTALRGQLTALGGTLPTANTMDAYLATLSPAWDNTAQDTPVDGLLWDTAWNSIFTEIAALQAAVQDLLNQATGGALEELRGYTGDGVLSPGEKARLVAALATATATWETLVAGAQAAGLPYDDLADAWLALSACVANLDPALDDLTAPTNIQGINLYGLWSAFDVAALELQVKLRSVSSGVTAIALANLPLSGAGTPAADGYDLQDGDTAMLAAQTDPAENGIYGVAITTTSGAATVENGSAATSLTSGASYTNDANSRDGNDATAATLTAGASGTSSVVYSGFNGSGTSGTIRVRVNPTLATVTETDYTLYYNLFNGTTEIHGSMEDYARTVTAKGTCAVSVSLDGGVTWTLAASWSGTSPGVQEISVPFTDVPQSRIRVRIDTTSQRVKYMYLDELFEHPWRTDYITGTAVAAIADVSLASTGSTAGYLLSRAASARSGQTFQVAEGTTWGGRTVKVAVAADNAYTLSSGGSYVPNFGTPPEANMVPTSDLAGKWKWTRIAQIGNNYTYWDPDYPSSSPSALNDEFDGSGLDAKWVKVNPTSACTDLTVNSQVPGALAGTLNVNSGNTIQALLQAIPVGDFCIVIKLDIEMFQNTTAFEVGIIISSTNTAGTGSQWCFGRVLNTSVSGTNYSQANLWTNFSAQGTSTYYFVPRRYYRIRRIGTSYFAGCSDYGKTWSDIAITPGFNAAYGGIFLQCYNNGVAKFSIEFFRYYGNGASSTIPGALVSV